MGKAVKVIAGIGCFALLFAGEAMGYMALRDKKVDTFKSNMSQATGMNVEAEYYGSTTNFHEPVIVYTEDGSTLKAVVAENSPNRFSACVNNTKIAYTKDGANTVKAIKVLGEAFIALATLTLLAFIVFILKI